MSAKAAPAVAPDGPFSTEESYTTPQFLRSRAFRQSNRLFFTSNVVVLLFVVFYCLPHLVIMRTDATSRPTATGAPAGLPSNPRKPSALASDNTPSQADKDKDLNSGGRQVDEQRTRASPVLVDFARISRETLKTNISIDEKWSLIVRSWPKVYSSAGGLALLVLDFAPVFIVLLAFRAFLTGAIGLADISLNACIARGVDQRGAVLVSSKTVPPIERLGGKLLSKSKQSPEPGAYRLIFRICEEAKVWRFESSSLLVEPLFRESAAWIIELQRLQRLALRLGILGTFVGLAVSLIHVKDAIEIMNVDGGQISEMSMGLRKILIDVLSSMGMAFGTSIMGLVIAIYTDMLARRLRRAHSTYMQNLDAATVTTLSLAMLSYKDDSTVVELRQLTQAMRDVNERMEFQAKRIDDGVRQVARVVEDLDKRLARRLTENALEFLDGKWTELTCSVEAHIARMLVPAGPLQDALNDRAIRAVLVLLAGFGIIFILYMLYKLVL